MTFIQRPFWDPSQVQRWRCHLSSWLKQRCFYQNPLKAKTNGAISSDRIPMWHGMYRSCIWTRITWIYWKFVNFSQQDNFEITSQFKGFDGNPIPAYHDSKQTSFTVGEEGFAVMKGSVTHSSMSLTFIDSVKAFGFWNHTRLGLEWCQSWPTLKKWRHGREERDVCMWVLLNRRKVNEKLTVDAVGVQFVVPHYEHLPPLHKWNQGEREITGS